MGICYSDTRSMKTEIQLEQKPLSDSWKASHTLVESDIVTLTHGILYRQYVLSQAEKRGLQSRRAQLVDGKLTDEYVNLSKAAKEADDRCLAKARQLVLLEYGVDQSVFDEANKKADAKTVLEAAQKLLFPDVRRYAIERLELTEDEIKAIVQGYQKAQQESSFTLSAYPDKSQQLDEIYGEDAVINAELVMVADSLYKKYKLQPVEVLAFLGDTMI